MNGKVLEQLTHLAAPWVGVDPAGDDVAFSTRVRLARNLDGFPFPSRASATQREQILHRLFRCADIVFSSAPLISIDMGDLEDVERHLLLERRLISRELCHMGRGSGVIVGADACSSVVVNEEDHVRIQTMASGLCLRQAWKTADDMDNRLQSCVDLAFRQDLGFLTACPTNLGTGMRASVMLHLPGLALCGQANAVVRAAVKLGMTVRGIYGEGSRAVGHLFQLSNQSTLGESEGQILDRLEGVVRQIAWHEQSARLRLLRDEPERIYDYVGKAYGILRYSHMITAEDALDRLAALRLGVDLKLIQGRMDRETIGRLMVTVQPGHLQQTTGTPLSETERDARRAEILRAAMGACENRGR